MNNGMKKCINCGREIPASYGFCKYCGVKQPTNNESATSQNSSNTNNYSYKIVTKTSNASHSNSYNADEAVNDANKRASLANKRAKEAEKVNH